MEQFHVKHALHPWYVTGFVEGCGSFTYSRSDPVLALYFAVKVSVRDRAILQGIQAFFGGAGRIYDISASPEGLVNARKSAYFRITRGNELEGVVSHFARYPPKGAKAQQFSIWRDMVAAKRRFRKADPGQLATLASRLSALNRGSGELT